MHCARHAGPRLITLRAAILSSIVTRDADWGPGRSSSPTSRCPCAVDLALAWHLYSSLLPCTACSGVRLGKVRLVFRTVYAAATSSATRERALGSRTRKGVNPRHGKCQPGRRREVKRSCPTPERCPASRCVICPLIQRFRSPGGTRTGGLAKARAGDAESLWRRKDGLPLARPREARVSLPHPRFAREGSVHSERRSGCSPARTHTPAASTSLHTRRAKRPSRAAQHRPPKAPLLLVRRQLVSSLRCIPRPHPGYPPLLPAPTLHVHDQHEPNSSRASRQAAQEELDQGQAARPNPEPLPKGASCQTCRTRKVRCDAGKPGAFTRLSRSVLLRPRGRPRSSSADPPTLGATRKQPAAPA